MTSCVNLIEVVCQKRMKRNFVSVIFKRKFLIGMKHSETSQNRNWKKFFYPAVRTGSSNTHFFFRFYPAVRTGSSNTHFFSVVFYPAVRTGSSNTRFYPAVRTGSSATRFFSLFSIFLVVTCPRPPVFARPNKYLSRLSLHSLGLVSWVAVIYFAP